MNTSMALADPSSDDRGALAPPVTDGRAVRWQAHREERRLELVRAARKAIHRLGAEAPMEEIAAAAGTSKSVFYRYFGDKAGLQLAVGDLVLGQMQARIAEAARTAQTPHEGLKAMVGAYLGMAVVSPGVYEFVTQLPAGEPAPPHGGVALRSFLDAVSALIDAPIRHHLGEERTSTRTFWPTAAIGLVRAAGESWLAAPEDPDKPTLEEMAALISSWLLNGVSAEPPD